jgi:HEAT repeat protein/energy-coupling factor transporter ATP-binding protein EcfA2
MPKFTTSDQTGRLGISHIAAICARLGWVWRETSCSDVGFDGEIEVVEGEDATGQIMKVQGKAGRSYMRNEKADSFDYYSDANHLEYWQRATNPVILVVYDPAAEATYWVDVKNYLALHPEALTGHPHKITFDKTRDRFTSECAEALRRVFGHDFGQAEAAYRRHIIDRFCKLTLYSVTSDAPLAVDLERVFVKLTATQVVSAQSVSARSRQLAEVFVPTLAEQRRIVSVLNKASAGNSRLLDIAFEFRNPMFQLSISDALSANACLVIIGAPGAGKTTLLKYLALCFARHQTKERLQLDEERLPIFIALRDFNRFLSNLDKQGKICNTDSLHLPLFLQEQTQEVAPHLKLPEDFFARALAQHRCVVLLDGLDEVADPLQRGRTAEVVANIASQYQGNRFVITSRQRGYESEARQRLAPLCAECTIRDFDDADRTEFAQCWYAAVVAEREGDNETSRAKAKNSAEDLLRAIGADARITALASNPLLLSILALVHQRGVGLPQRRVDLYAESTEMLLGYWDQVRGGEAAKELATSGGLDRQEKRALLEPVALWLHERGESGSEVVEKELVAEIARQFRELFGDPGPQSQRRAEFFLRVITERAGLLVERETGVFGFAHLSFQEYLAARAVADRDDYMEFILRHLHDPWWREVILLAVGHLGSFKARQYRARTTALIQAVRDANSWLEDVLKRDLLLACRSLVDVSQLGVDEKLRQTAFEDLFALWQTTPFEPQRLEIASIFAYAGPTSDGERIRHKLVSLLGDQDSSVRGSAAEALGQMGATAATPDTLARLLELLADASDAVRRSATEALGEIGAAAATPDTLARLLELLGDPSDDVRARVAYAFGRMGAAATTPDTLARLSELVGERSPSVSGCAACALKDLGAAAGTPDMLAWLLKLSRDASDEVCCSAVSALGQMGAAAATPYTLAGFLEVLGDPSDAMRRSAAEALGQMGAAAATPNMLVRLLKLLGDPSDAVRGSTAEALGRMGAAAATPGTLARLLQLLRDRRDVVCHSAADALGRMGAVAVDPQIVKLLADFWSGLLKDVATCALSDGSNRVCDKAFKELQNLASHPAATDATE